MISVWFTVLAVVLGASALAITWRIIVGPTILDRVLASDVLVVLLVCVMAMISAATGTSWLFAPMLVLVLVGFIGTVAVSRFVAREAGS